MSKILLWILLMTIISSMTFVFMFIPGFVTHFNFIETWHTFDWTSYWLYVKIEAIVIGLLCIFGDAGVLSS